MSERVLAKTTLFELQMECERRGGRCIVDGECKYHSICKSMHINGYLRNPRDWNLTDPPRFNEQQMAFFRGLRGLGVVKLDTCVRNGQPTAFDASGNIFYYEFLDNVEFPLDLAELIEKGGEK